MKPTLFQIQSFLLFQTDPGALSPAEGQAVQASRGSHVSSTEPPGSMSLIVLLLPLALVVFMFWSTSKQKKKDEEARAKLKRGDKVVSQSGLVGELVELEGKLVKVKLAPGLTVNMLSSSIGPFQNAEGDKDKSDPLKDLKANKGAEDKK